MGNRSREKDPSLRGGKQACLGCDGQDTGKLKASYFVGGRVKWCSSFGKQFGSF